MPDNKFESFFYENNIFYLEDNLTNNGKLLPSFNRDALFCPECKQAKLKFTSATSQRNAFLSTWPGNVHAPNCDYGFEAASKREICEYYRTLTDDQIQDKLAACMNHFFKPDTAATHLEPNNEIENNPIILTNQETRQHKRLLTRSLRSVVMRNDDMLDTPILFYGKVKLEVQNYKTYRTIKLSNLKSNSPFLYLNTSLFKNISLNNIEQDVEYKFIFLGLYQNGKKYPKLYNDTSFIFNSN